MSVRIKVYNTNADIAGDDNATEWQDTDLNQRIGIDSEGYQYSFSPNEAKNFLDDGRGLAVPASSTTVNIVQDAIPFGSGLS